MTGAELKEIREKIGVSQGEFANMLSIGHSTLNRYEKDRNPIPGPIQRLAVIFHYDRSVRLVHQLLYVPRFTEGPQS